MSARDKILEEKKRLVETTLKEIHNIETLEVGRVYKIQGKINYWSKSEDHEIWGVLETFNKESMRFGVIATEWDQYEDIGLPLDEQHRWRNQRKNVFSIHYSQDVVGNGIVRAKKEDMALLIGLPYKIQELEDILKGTSKKRWKFD